MVGWDEINAYVDGELDADDIARMAAAIAGDASLAARVATIARLKAATVATARPREVPPHPVGKAPTERRWRPSWKRLALAASLALLILAGGVARLGQSAAVDPIAAAAIEQVWLSGTASEGRAVLEVAAAGRTHLFPDLSAADLHLHYVSFGPAGQAGGAFAGYVGPNGCRLGLWWGPGQGETYPPTPRDVGSVRIRAWSDGPRTFALMSRSMGGERLDHVTALVTALVADLTRRTRPDDERARSPLYAAARARIPCLG
ncbi:anti-sigma factor family protein [Methylobacterium sp. Leaf118]|uniref:anti-sigma factor family protein n=1 Tax=Methylobacterium sp. Leaf118 TaxID=2876562 RepID=UPI001E52897C|nr:hypothetical protein [Methylobacterium sp. Leaf118]